MDMNVLLLTLATAALAVCGLVWGGKIPRAYRQRRCRGRKWKKEFPHSSKDEIRKFLDVFTTAFVFDSSERLKFEPQDRVIDIYTALYPLKGTDALELETFAKGLEKEYDVNFSVVWNVRLGLGELFRIVIAIQPASQRV